MLYSKKKHSHFLTHISPTFMAKNPSPISLIDAIPTLLCWVWISLLGGMLILMLIVSKTHPMSGVLRSSIRKPHYGFRGMHTASMQVPQPKNDLAQK